jgi:hypothetical protein
MWQLLTEREMKRHPTGSSKHHRQETLAAAIASWLGRPVRATADDRRTIELKVSDCYFEGYPPCFIMCLTDAFRTLKAVSTLTFKVERNSSSDVEWAGFRIIEPMQFVVPERLEMR